MAADAAAGPKFPQAMAATARTGWNQSDCIASQSAGTAGAAAGPSAPSEWAAAIRTSRCSSFSALARASTTASAVEAFAAAWSVFPRASTAAFRTKCSPCSRAERSSGRAASTAAGPMLPMADSAAEWRRGPGSPLHAARSSGTATSASLPMWPSVSRPFICKSSSSDFAICRRAGTALAPIRASAHWAPFRTPESSSLMAAATLSTAPAALGPMAPRAPTAM
mmetsp:Transcript_43012/g.115960  ORF Transcript_43012/g.115960 Transcript_43012/m.115960 type:complete len:223 (-) Transcript_43012:439-1107(-)